MRQPDFDNLLAVLNRQRPKRPTLFEFFMHDKLYEFLAGEEITSMPEDELKPFRIRIHAFKNAGYDYVTVMGSGFSFPTEKKDMKETISLNEGCVIFDRESFRKYCWPDPDAEDYSILDKLADELPEGMKIIVWGPGGVLENVVSLVGYENLCYMVFDNPALAADIFEAVGSRLERYYQICAKYDTVGALISNDDWGFNTQTMLAPSDLRKYVIPWHKRIVNTIHHAGKPAILHSCGNLEAVMEDIISAGYDAKHSFEDKIIPVEQAYEKWGGRIAILGGIDLNFICQATPQEISTRCKKMLNRARHKGGYALGSGNSIPHYVPVENYLAMINTVLK